MAARLPKIREDAENGLRPRVRDLVAELRALAKEPDRRTLAVDEGLAAEVQGNDACQ